LNVQTDNLAWKWQRDRLFGSQPSVNFNNNTRFNNGTAYTATMGGAGIAGNGDLNKDERFMVWMRPEAHFTFQKLWGVINQDIPAGVHSWVRCRKVGHMSDVACDGRRVNDSMERRPCDCTAAAAATFSKGYG
jgi:hypothetical protein